MKYLNTLATFFALLFAVPTLLILLSWNSLPGDALYGVKTGLEDTVLVLTARTPLASKFSVQFTERRFTEANKLLATQGSTIGFDLLVEETQQSKEIIVKKQDAKNGAELLAKIEEYEERIDQQQKVIEKSVAQQQPVVEQQVQVQQPVQEQQPTITQPPPQQVVTVEEPPQPTKASPIPVPPTAQPEKLEQVAIRLEETKKELEKVKEEIKKELPEAASDRAREAREEKRDRKDSDKDKEDRKQEERENENKKEHGRDKE